MNSKVFREETFPELFNFFIWAERPHGMGFNDALIHSIGKPWPVDGHAQSGQAHDS